MEKIKPFILCTDFWPDRIPKDKMLAYRAMADEGQIRIHQVIVNRKTESTIIEYYSTVPQEWIHQEMRKIVSG